MKCALLVDYQSVMRSWASIITLCSVFGILTMLLPAMLCPQLNQSKTFRISLFGYFFILYPYIYIEPYLQVARLECYPPFQEKQNLVGKVLGCNLAET